MKTSRPVLQSLALPLLLTAAGACDAIEVFNPLPDQGGPAGIIEGTVTYAGPLPCTQGGRIVGAAILLAFDTRLLPPPDGLGTTAASLDVVTGEELFSGVRNKLVFLDGNARWCPDPAAPGVTVSADWTMGPLSGAKYQVRGFYDLDGDFDPAFSISNLPSKGDIGGGAIDNAAEVLLGMPAVYRAVELGTEKNGAFVIPDEGARVKGVAVTFALPLPLDRPIFHAKEVIDTHEGNVDPAHVIMPSDVQLEKFSTVDPNGTEASFIKLKLGAGLPADEIATGAAFPFNLKVNAGGPCIPGSAVNAPCFLYARQDVNHDGMFDASDNVPEGPVPALLPVVVFSKLLAGKKIGNQSSPAVILQGLTLYDTLASTAFAPATLNDARDEVLVAIRPAVLCIDTVDLARPGVLVTSRATDSAGNPLITDEPAVKAKLTAQFGRPIDLAYGCLPQGELAMNIIYDTGQAWSVPNETAVCAANEEPSADGKVCGKRAVLASQGVVLTIGPPKDPAYCVTNPTPAACLPAP